VARENVTGERDERPWGEYEVVDEGDGYLVKRITVRSGKRISYQRHRSRSEHWFVVTGRGVTTIDDEERRVSPGSTVDIAVGAAHRIASDDGSDLTFIEVQTGDYLGEDDIERLHDDYGRTQS
jgi:mannose-6-phosphate isomerase